MASNIKHILVVDDLSNWRNALRKLLENEGLRVSEAKNIEGAKERIIHSEFDLAVLDVRLVNEDRLNLSGIDLLHFIREHSPHTKTMIITSYPESIRNRPRADELILKVPDKSTFDIKGFQEKVRRLLKD